MNELGIQPSALGVARHYRGLLDGFVLDSQDEAMAEAIRDTGVAVTVANTVMHSLQDREQLARVTLAFARDLMVLNTQTTTGHVGAGSG
jgi:LPPG:FO 2-phospho-L-lactate transferase